MSQSYKKSCIYCNKTIEMNDKASGKWLPYDMSGTQHDCRKQEQTQGTKTGPQIILNQDPVKENENITMSPEARAWVVEVQKCPTKVRLLEQRLAKVEEMLFGKGK